LPPRFLPSDNNRQIDGIDEDRHAIDKVETAADDQAHACGLGGLLGADDASGAIAVVRSVIASASIPSLAASANNSS
jgi:hypothetical protein